MQDTIYAQLAMQTDAAKMLLAQCADILGDDAEAAQMAIESETNLVEVIERAAKRVASIDAMIDGIKETQAGLRERAERFKKQREMLRTAVLVAMEGSGMARLELPICTISTKRVPQALEITDESLLPSKFFVRPDPVLDRKALLEALKAKEDVPGATLDNGGSSIQMKFS